MKKEIKYHHFKDYILRTPSFNFNSKEFLELTGEDVFNLFNSDYFFRESIFVASPIFFNEVVKSLSTGNQDGKLATTLLKYYVRSKTRCTPFGLFAGCTSGEIGNETAILLKNKKEFKKHTRLDMELVSILAIQLSSLPEIQKQIKLFTNNTLYPISDFYSYIESKIVEKRKTYYKSTAEYTDYLASILDFCETGKFFGEIVEFLEKMEFEKRECVDYISELIESQILTNEWEISTLDPNPFKTLIQKVKFLKFEKCSQIPLFIEQCENLINEFSNSDDTVDRISQMEKGAEVFSFLKHDSKNIFQTDLQTVAYKNSLSEKTVKKLENVIEFIQKFTPNSGNDPLDKFKQRFYKKYENEEIPLLEVLDEDFGLGYPFLEDKLLTPLLDKIKFPKKSIDKKYSWTKKDAFLSKKLSDFFLNNDKNCDFVEITDEDLRSFDTEQKQNLPNTLSAMVEIYWENNKELIYVPVFMSSAAKLLGRFSYFNENLKIITKIIIEKEAEYHDDGIIFAEIAHLPEAKDGNVILRPQLTDYEIPILSQSLLDEEYQIQLKDLALSIVGNKLILKSLKLNKKVVPQLTSAYNSGNPKNLSIYKFLADLQYQDIEKNIQFSWGIIGKDFKYLPRVIYKDLILSKAYWNIPKEEVGYFSQIKNRGELANKIEEWRCKNRIPFVVAVKDLDNKLYIDFRNEIFVDLFLSSIKKNKDLVLEEVLFKDENLFVKNEDGETFTNEFIINFYKIV